MTPTRAVLIVAAACFALLALTAALIGTPPGDGAIRETLLAIATPPVVEAMRAINWAGSWRVLLPGTLLLLVAFPRARGRWYLWIGLMIVAPATEGILKVVVGRPRPEEASMGFPSGHATAAAAFFGALVYLAGPLPARARAVVRAAAIAVIVLVALARVMLRAHWPSDVVGGIALGLAFASGAALLAERRGSSSPSSRIVLR